MTRMTSSTAAIAKSDDAAAAQNNYKIIQEVGNFEELEAARPDFDHCKPIALPSHLFLNGSMVMEFLTTDRAWLIRTTR